MEAKREITYPQYRKYLHGKTFFKIHSADYFEEIQWMGSRCTVHQFQAKILPDRNFIFDMTFDYEKNWIEISEAEYLLAKSKCG
ncbi:MAG: hypothetical protein ABI199_07145 [Bacteroidia bacterium]